MKREDFIFTIGYDGSTAIVDGKARRKYGRLTTEGLLAEGLYKAAFCSALYDEDEDAISAVMAAYNENKGAHYRSAEELKRLFGVNEVPEVGARTKLV